MILFKRVEPAVLSPCISVCTLDDDGLCLGCRRSAEEIERWAQLDDAERQAIMDVLPDRQ